MKKKQSRAVAPTLPVFRTTFLRVLQSYYNADAVIARILKDKTLQEHCAVLLWLTVNDARERLARQTDREHTLWASKLDEAIKGTKAMEQIYVVLDNKPHLAEYMSTLRSDLEKKRKAVDTAFASPKHYGTNRDWFIVQYAKITLEALVRLPISNRTIADLLNAADEVVGRTFARKKTQVEEADVTMGLRRLNKRTFERMLPALQKLLSEQYPTASDFPAAS
jgi:hypothetical protein